MRATCSVISKGQIGTPRPTRTRGKGYIDRTGASCRKRTATAGAGVGLREVSRVGPAQGNTADAEWRRAAVGEGHGLRRTGRAHILVAKVDTRRTQTHHRSCCSTRPAQRYALGAASRVIGERQAGAARPVGTGRKGHADGAGATRRKLTAATGAGVGLRKVRRIRSAYSDAADA